jgi:predicted Ser/Thr protein kinase
MKTANDFIVFLRTQGYSERAIEEICKWYVCSTTKSSSGKLPVWLRN